MARGWESKAVEEQQAQADRDVPVTAPALTEAAAERAQRKASLTLARTRVLADLQQACRPAHRAMLEAALADIDRRLQSPEHDT